MEHFCQADVDSNATFYGEKLECADRCGKPARCLFDTGLQKFWLCAEHYDRLMSK